MAAPRERMDVGVECQLERVNVTAERDSGREGQICGGGFAALMRVKGGVRHCGRKVQSGKGSESPDLQATMLDLLQDSVILLWRSHCARSASQLQVF